MRLVIKWAISCIAIGFIIGASLAIMIAVINLQERRECEDWQRYEVEARESGLESQAWQKAQCLEHGMVLGY